MLYTPRLISSDSWQRHASFGQASEAFAEVLANRPVILITGHFNNWEMMGYDGGRGRARARGLSPARSQAARPLGAPGARERGMMMVDKFGAVRELPRAMRGACPLSSPTRTRAIAALRALLRSAHEHVQVRGHAGDADGRASSAAGCPQPTPRPDGVDMLHDHATGRWQDAMGYRFDIHDVIRPEDWKDAPDPLFYITARYRRSIENMVRTARAVFLDAPRLEESPGHERLRKEFPDNLSRAGVATDGRGRGRTDRRAERTDIETLDRLGAIGWNKSVITRT